MQRRKGTKRFIRKGFYSYTFHLGSKVARTVIVSMSIALAGLFVLVGIAAVQLVVPERQNSLAGHFLHSLNSRSLGSILHQELPLYASADPHLDQAPQRPSQLKSLLVYALTNIDVEHPVTMLGEQIPALAVTQFDPISKDASEPPGEDRLPPQTKQTPPSSPSSPSPPQEEQQQKEDQPLVYIYHTHNRESFLPELGRTDDPEQAYDAKKNITLVGERLQQALQREHIPAIQTKTDYWNKGNVENEYDLSRKTVQGVLKKYNSLKMVFDIHRDSLPRDKTTVQLGGKNVAQVYFIIGGSNPNSKKNEAFALRIHERMQQMYPGVSKGAYIARPNPAFDTRYNQDLFADSVLIEIGGPENTLDEEYRTADLLAKVIASLLREQK